MSGLSGVVSGYRFDGPVRARAVLEPVVAVYGVDATERDGAVVFRMRGADVVEVDAGRLVEEDAPALALVRTGLEGPAPRVRLRYVNAEVDHAPGVVVSVGDGAGGLVEVEVALALDGDQAQRVADALAQGLVEQQEHASFALAAAGVVLEAGDVVELGGDTWRVVNVSDGSVVRAEAVRAGMSAKPVLTQPVPVAGVVAAAHAMPDVVIVDAPPLPGVEDDLRPIVFAYAAPWTGAVVVSAGVDVGEQTVRGRVVRVCTMGVLASALHAHVSGRWQEASVVVSVAAADLQSRSEGSVLNGANAALVQTAQGWELVQFAQAELVDVETWKLSGLLRGQQGSEPAMAAGAAVGARIVFLTGAEQRVEVSEVERGLTLEWRAWREAPDEATAWTGEATHMGLAAQMWSPAHLRTEWSSGDMAVGWVRRARKGGDPWAPGEPPHEVAEAYRVRVSAGGSVLRGWDVAESSSVYAAAEQAMDFPSGGMALIEVAQLGADGEPGAWAGVIVTIPPP